MTDEEKVCCKSCFRGTYRSRKVYLGAVNVMTRDTPSVRYVKVVGCDF